MRRLGVSISGAVVLLACQSEHSTGQWRVNGSVSDNVEFARVFQCKPGDRMVPAQRCEVW